MKDKTTRKMVSSMCILTSLFLFVGTIAPSEGADVRKKVPHITAREAFALYETGRLILLDVHTAKNKTRSLLLGALYIPAYKIGKVKLKIPPNMVIGVFCD